MAKTKSYWEKRQEQWVKNQDKKDGAVAKKLEKDYNRTAKELEKEIASYFQKYGKDDVIEFRDMLQELDEDDRRMLFEDMNKFFKEYPDYAHLVPIRESIYQLNRLEGLHFSTQLKLLELGAIEQKMFEQHLLETYGRNYEALLSELGIGHTFLGVNNEIALQTIYTKWMNDENFSDRIWNNKEKLLNYLRNDYRDALVRGDNYDKLINQLMSRMDVGKYEARRLIWTESSFVMNQAHIQPYIDLGVEEYELNAMMDDRTSEICRNMNGKVFSFDEMAVGINYPPFHPWCRTMAIGVGLDELLD